MLEIPEPWYTYQGELLIRCRVSPIERGVLQLTNLEGVGYLKSTLTSDIEMQSLECALLVFSLALVPCFLTMVPFLSFGMVIYILCHHMDVESM